MAEASVNRAGGGDPDAVAARAEIVAQRGDETDTGAGFGNVEIASRTAGAVDGWGKGKPLLQQLTHFGQIEMGRFAVDGDVTERHGFDHRKIEAAFTAPCEQGWQFAIVHAAHRDRVDAHGEAGAARGVDAAHDLVEFVAPGQLCKACRIERVEADVDTADTGGCQIVGQFGQQRAIGRQCDFVQPVFAQICEAGDEIDDALADERFAASEADTLYAAADEVEGEAFDFVESEQIPARHELHVLGHAVGAAQVAAVRHREADVVDPASKCIVHGDAPTRCRAIPKRK